MSQPRVLVLGAGGMLGHKMFQTAVATFPDTWGTLRETIDAYPVAGINEFRSKKIVERCDAMDLGSIDVLLDKLRPDAVINCVGIIKQRPAAYDAITSITVNSLLPYRLAAKLDEWGGRLIHVSTDCVFDGSRGSYTELDRTDATDLYGRTKALGEVTSSNSVTLRTSIIGRELREHRSLLDWFLSQTGRKVVGYRQAWWSGVTTNHLADLISSLIERHSTLSGLFQVSSRRMSKYDLLQLIRKAYALEIDIEPDDGLVIDRSLTGDKLETAIGYRCPPWSELLSKLVSDPTAYQTAKP
ncbi:MAG: dTDP-4-dehydrorhamnose reductase family protein [Gemmatimonadaceae bacterium]